MEDRLTRLEQDVKEINTRVRSVENNQLVFETNKQHIDRRFDTIERSQDDLKKSMESSQEELKTYAIRIIFIVLGVVVAGFTKWLLEGGLSSVI